jgi:phosphate transport system substrate-binding protein
MVGIDGHAGAQREFEGGRTGCFPNAGGDRNAREVCVRLDKPQGTYTCQREKVYNAVARKFPATVLILAAAGLAACSGSGNPPPGPAATSTSSRSGSSSSSSVALPLTPAPGPQSLSETGSTLFYPLFSEWAPAYKSQFPNVTITTAGTGSSTGISSAASGTADIGASDAYLSSGDMIEHPVLENIPLAISAQQVNYNLPGVKGNLKLNSTVLAEMYQGKITMWNDAPIRALNPGLSLPATKVIPIHRSEGSGDTFLFTSYLSQPGSSWAESAGFATTVAWPPVPGALAEKGNSGMLAGCAANPGCVAYIGISYASQTSAAGLGEAQLLNGSGSYVLPSPASISAEAAGFALNTPANGAISLIDGPASGGYPLVNYEYAIVSTRQPTAAKAASIKALLNWILTKGSSAAYLSNVHFRPLPSQVVTIADALIEKIA